MTPIIYALNEFKQLMNYPLNMMSKHSNNVLEPFLAAEEKSFINFINAMNDMVYRATLTYEKPHFDIDHVMDGDKQIPIHIKTVVDKPFCTLIHFEREKKPKKKLPPLLITAPMSGHFASLLRGTIAKCLEDHDVYVTDWKNARNVSMLHGGFSLDTYVGYLIEFIKLLNQDELHILAVCQPAVPVMMATSILASQNDPQQPNSMILMGGPIDTRVNPGPVNDFAKDHDIEWFHNNLVARVPHYYEGANREVIPGFIMLGGFMALNPDRHQQASYEYFEKLVGGDMESSDAHRKFYDEYRAVMDLPASYFLQSIDLVFRTYGLPEETIVWNGFPVKPSEIQKTALLTVEGEKDEISPIGQTFAAHNICKNLPKKHKFHHLQKGVGHYGVFNGRRWRDEIYPTIKDFTKKYATKIT